MKRINFEVPVMELITLGAEDIICASPAAPTQDPHFVKGNDATVKLEQKRFTDVNFSYTGESGD